MSATLAPSHFRKPARRHILALAAALGLHALLLGLWVMTPKSTILQPTDDFALNIELWSNPVITEPVSKPATKASTQSRARLITPLKPHIAPAGVMSRPGVVAEGATGFGRWAVKLPDGPLSEGLKHPRRCFGLDTPPEGRPKDCPQWALNGTPSPETDPDRAHWSKEIAQIERHRKYMNTQCNDPNFAGGVTALNAHRGDRVRFRSGCRGDQDARDEVDFKRGQAVDTVNRPDYGS